MTKGKKPPLPPLLNRKISKTGQTRGADDDVIYQNRVNRNNTVLIPYHQWIANEQLRKESEKFDNGYIVLISPADYFSLQFPGSILENYGLILGQNCLVFYETRADWNQYNPEVLGWTYANNRCAPLNGQYVARIPAIHAAQDFEKINRGYTSQSSKGAGIRLYEYASAETIRNCRLQLEALFWLCYDSMDVVSAFGMTPENAELRKRQCLQECASKGLLDYNRLSSQRIIDKEHHTICPFCLKKLSGNGFFNRLPQPAGREVPDLTVTEVNLFHIDELKYGAYNHKPYNLGWGCHHCNVVVKDSGIYPTLSWLQEIINRNIEQGYPVT